MPELKLARVIIDTGGGSQHTIDGPNVMALDFVLDMGQIVPGQPPRLPRMLPVSVVREKMPGGHIREWVGYRYQREFVEQLIDTPPEKKVILAQ